MAAITPTQATQTVLDRSKLEGSGADPNHAKALLDKLDLFVTAMNAAKTDIAALNTVLTAEQGYIDTLQTDLDTAEASLATAEGNVTTLQTDLDTAEASLATAETNITALQAQQGRVRVWASTEQTGTGSSQDIAHSLTDAAGSPAVPDYVMWSITDLGAGLSGTFAVTEGVHDATNVKVTATSGLKFKVLAVKFTDPA